MEYTEKSLLQRISAGYDSLWQLLIKPTRSEYSSQALGPPQQWFESKGYWKHDYQVVSHKGFRMECTFFEPIKQDKSSGTLSSTKSSGGGSVENNNMGESVLADSNERLGKSGASDHNEGCPVLVYCHSQTGNRLEGLPLLEHCALKGLGLLLFDFAGCGLSQGEYVSLGWFESIDLALIVADLRTRFKIDSVSLWGRSMGAVTCILYGEKHQDKILSMVLDSPFSSLKDMLIQIGQNKVRLPAMVISMALGVIGRSVKERLGIDLLSLEPGEVARRCTIPALFIVARNDEILPPKSVMDIYDRYKCPTKTILNSLQGTHSSERDQETIVQGMGLITDQISKYQFTKTSLQAAKEHLAPRYAQGGSRTTYQMMDDPFLRSPPQKPTKQAQMGFPTPAAFELPKPVRSVEQTLDPEASNADLADLLNIMSPGRNQRAFVSPSLPKQSQLQGFPDRYEQDIYTSNYTEVQSGPARTDFANSVGPQPIYGRQVFTPQKTQFSHPQTHASAATKPGMHDLHASTNYHQNLTRQPEWQDSGHHHVYRSPEKPDLDIYQGLASGNPGRSWEADTGYRGGASDYQYQSRHTPSTLRFAAEGNLGEIQGNNNEAARLGSGHKPQLSQGSLAMSLTGQHIQQSRAGPGLPKFSSGNQLSWQGTSQHVQHSSNLETSKANYSQSGSNRVRSDRTYPNQYPVPDQAQNPAPSHNFVTGLGPAYVSPKLKPSQQSLESSLVGVKEPHQHPMVSDFTRPYLKDTASHQISTGYGTAAYGQHIHHQYPMDPNLRSNPLPGQQGGLAHTQGQAQGVGRSKTHYDGSIPQTSTVGGHHHSTTFKK